MEFDTVHRGKQCSYCGRSFSRSEHLSRHERSHRNERPYRCTPCNASFSRQDTFKRHQSRYHSQATDNSLRQHSQETSKIDMPMTAQNGSEDPPTFDLTNILTDDNPVLDTSVLEFPLSGYLSDLTKQDSHNFLHAELAPSYFTPSLESVATPACEAQTTNSSALKGSFVISEQKHRQLVFEIDMVAPARGPSDFKVPTRFAFERLMNTFAECFLIYIPCIHTPTWKAEAAPPCLILAMASIGASYHDDDITSLSLYSIARASIKNYLSLSLHTIADEPLWVLQCLLLVTSNGSKRASFKSYQEATSLTSLLIEGARHRKCPAYEPEVDGAETGLIDQWHRWIEFETTKRTICAIFVCLSALGINFQTANGLCNLDMSNCLLPCEESEWMSRTPEAWLRNRQTSFRHPVTFSVAMLSLLSSHSASSLSLSTFGLYVVLHGLVKQLVSLSQDIWLLAATPILDQRFEQALDRWRIWSEQNPEFHISPRYPCGVVAANALSLYRQACVRLCADFGQLRSAFATRDAEAILYNIKDIEIEVSSSGTCLRAARCALEALQTSVQMGLFLTESISGWHRKLLFNLHSIECCLFLSFWIREQSSRPTPDRSSEENDLVKLTQETLTEIALVPRITTKPHSIQLIYAWAWVFRLCNAPGLHGLYGIVAEALETYADSLSE